MPGWVGSPWTLRAVNGEANGDHRVASARIEIDGTEVAGPSDFKKHVDVLERAVTLAPTSTLELTLSSKPGSFLTVSLCGANADHTPPELTVAAPAPGSAIANPTPELVVRYRDPAGPSEPGASGVETETFEVALDDVDRTGLFSVMADDARATLPDELALAEGLHVLRARVKDVAGNQGERVSEFRVDLTPPAIAIDAPHEADVLGTDAAPVRVVYSDAGGLDLASLSIRVNGVDRTGLFAVTPTEATATLTLATGLQQGSNQIVAEVRDGAGNHGVASVGFTIDTVPPEIVIGEPAEGSRHGSADVEVTIEYRDDQALDPGSFEATLDGGPVTLTAVPGGVTGWLGPLADGRARAGGLGPRRRRQRRRRHVVLPRGHGPSHHPGRSAGAGRGVERRHPPDPRDVRGRGRHRRDDAGGEDRRRRPHRAPRGRRELGDRGAPSGERSPRRQAPDHRPRARPHRERGDRRLGVHRRHPGPGRGDRGPERPDQRARPDGEGHLLRPRQRRLRGSTPGR